MKRKIILPDLSNKKPVRIDERTVAFVHCDASPVEVQNVINKYTKKRKR